MLDHTIGPSPVLLNSSEFVLNLHLFTLLAPQFNMIIHPPLLTLHISVCSTGQVVKDMAQGKNTFQSSTYHLYGWSYLAVDGSENPDYYTKSCTATNSDNQAWWTVDLIVPSTIHYVELLNRADCCRNPLGKTSTDVERTFYFGSV